MTNVNEKIKQAQDELKEEIVNLVIARLEALPSNASLSIGGEGDFDIKELVQHVKEGDEIGEKVVEMQLDFLRSLKDLTPPSLENVSSNN